MFFPAPCSADVYTAQKNQRNKLLNPWAMIPLCRTPTFPHLLDVLRVSTAGPPRRCVTTRWWPPIFSFSFVHDVDVLDSAEEFWRLRRTLLGEEVRSADST